jgi:hypothetical protein
MFFSLFNLPINILQVPAETFEVQSGSVLHQWWLCNSGGCSRVVCSKSVVGADLHFLLNTAFSLYCKIGHERLTNVAKN